MLHVGGIVGAGAKPDLMISRKMLKDMEGADFVALVGRERDPMRKEEYFCHTPDETKNNPLRLILPSANAAPQPHKMVLPYAAWLCESRMAIP